MAWGDKRKLLTTINKALDEINYPSDEWTIGEIRKNRITRSQNGNTGFIINMDMHILDSRAGEASIKSITSNERLLARMVIEETLGIRGNYHFSHEEIKDMLKDDYLAFDWSKKDIVGDRINSIEKQARERAQEIQQEQSSEKVTHL